MKINLHEIAGDFCTRRTSPVLKKLKEILQKNIEKNETMVIDVTGVKILTPSFIDELLPPLMIKHGEKKVNSLVSFNPPLEGFLKEQIKRGFDLRKNQN